MKVNSVSSSNNTSGNISVKSKIDASKRLALGGKSNVSKNLEPLCNKLPLPIPFVTAGAVAVPPLSIVGAVIGVVSNIFYDKENDEKNNDSTEIKEQVK